MYAARDVDTVGILRAGGAAAAGAALLALLYWKLSLIHIYDIVL